MPVLERPRSRKAQESESERSDRVRKRAQQQEEAQPLGNQATLRMLAASRKKQNRKPPAQEPDTPEGKADQVVDRFEADPADQSGRTRADLEALPPDQRGEVMNRVADKVSETEFGRIGRIVSEPGPRSPVTPPKEKKPAEAPEEAQVPEAPEAMPEDGAAKKASKALPEEEREKEQDDEKEEEEQREKEHEKKLDTGTPEEPSPEVRALQGPPSPTKEKEGKEGKEEEEAKGKDGDKAGEQPGKPTPAEGARTKGEARGKNADPTKGDKPEAQKQSEVVREDQADGEKEAEKAATAIEKQPSAQARETKAGATEAGPQQASQALSDLPPAAKGAESQAPAGVGPAARQAAVQPGPAVTVAGGGGGGEGGGGGGGDTESALEEGAESAEQESATDSAEEKMAAAQPAAEQEKEDEEEQPASDELGPKSESADDLTKPPTAEDQEVVKQAERERQEQTRSPEGAAAVQPAEDEQEPPPADRAEVNPAEARAGLESLAEGAGGGEPDGGGGGGGGGAISDQPEPEPPKVESMSPVGAIGAVSGLKVGQISKSIAGVQGAVSTKMGSERADLAANAPSMERPSGSPQTRDSRLEMPSAVATAAAPVEEAPPAEAVEGEAPQLLPDPGPSPTDQVVAPPIQGGGEGGTLSEADAENVESAVDEVPTTDPALDQNAGTPPTVALTGDADPQQAADQRSALDQTIVDQQTQGAQDVAQPMGEDQIYPVVPQETLTATVAAEGGGGGATAAAAVDDETTAIVAEEKQGDEVRASAQQASGDMQAGEEEHATNVEQANADHQTKVQDLESENAAQQSGERGAAAQQVEQARGKWSQGQQQAVGKAQGDADAAQATMSTEVAAQKQQGDQKAAAEIDKGNADAATLRTKAEGEASQKKAEAQEESSGGILGWIASKAAAFFEGLKKAVHAVFDFYRNALKSLIDGVRKLAAAAIDLARDAIVGAIKLAGKVIVAVGDVVLAAFPDLRDRFRGFIEEKVKAAEDTVNQLAEDLKAGINKLLDLLASALNGLLNLLEKAYMAAIDVVAGAVQAAIKAAQAAIALLGLLAAIIKDVAANPGQWISNLGAAVVDGIKNHLWKAFKAAVKNWFFSKLEEVLGLGMTIFNVLFKGGIKLAEIGTMAFEGLKAAIPTALIGILVEKLVAMIVPAAGAVMVIIESLQAAWGTISRILQAIDRFVSFLKAVKSGTAGPKFADALAAAAVVVIDFVANWLIKRVRKPAGKIGGKIKAIARKILDKLKAVAKKIGRAIKKAFKKVVAKIKGAFKKVKEKLFGKKKKGKAKQKDDENKKKKKEKKIQEAIEKTKDAVAAMLSKGTKPLVMKAKLAYLKLRYGWQQLSLQREGSAYTIKGHINPDFSLPANVSFRELVVHVNELNINPNKIADVPTLDRPLPKSARVGGMKPAEFAQAAVLGGALSGRVPGLESGGFAFMGQGSAAGRLDPTNPRLDPSTSPDQRAFLGERQYPVSGEPLSPAFSGVASQEEQLRAHQTVEMNKPKPDAVVLQMEGSQVIRNINIEATLDGELSQGHKESQMYRTIIAAQEVMSRFPPGTVSLGDLEIHYVIIAPKAAESAKGKLQAQFDQLKGKIASRVTVTWIYVEGLG
jgi:hypothetical protein